MPGGHTAASRSRTSSADSSMRSASSVASHVRSPRGACSRSTSMQLAEATARRGRAPDRTRCAASARTRASSRAAGRRGGSCARAGARDRGGRGTRRGRPSRTGSGTSCTAAPAPMWPASRTRSARSVSRSRDSRASLSGDLGRAAAAALARRRRARRPRRRHAVARRRPLGRAEHAQRDEPILAHLRQVARDAAVVADELALIGLGVGEVRVVDEHAGDLAARRARPALQRLAVLARAGSRPRARRRCGPTAAARVTGRVPRYAATSTPCSRERRAASARARAALPSRRSARRARHAASITSREPAIAAREHALDERARRCRDA